MLFCCLFVALARRGIVSPAEEGGSSHISCPVRHTLVPTNCMDTHRTLLFLLVAPGGGGEREGRREGNEKYNVIGRFK